MPVLLCGIPSEPALAMVQCALEDMGEPTVVFNQRQFEETRIEWSLDGTEVTGDISLAGQTYRLDQFSGVFSRLMDEERLPEVVGRNYDDPLRERCRLVHAVLAEWCEVAKICVVNRSAAAFSNCSKPLQAQMIASHGFAVPDTVVTDDPQVALAFARQYGEVVYKSMSGIRSIVQLLDADALARLDRVRWCPVQFQERVAGVDIRVHVVGRALFATAVHSEAVDYRYATSEGLPDPMLESIDLPDDIAARCVSLARVMGLELAGIDLRVAPDGRYYCFEVNPSPAFSYYEAHSGQPIATAVAALLSAS